jgi:hypothetical protein
MPCFALAKGNAVLAKQIFWEMPLCDLWVQLWCYYRYNDVKLKRIDEEEDILTIMDA